MPSVMRGLSDIPKNAGPIVYDVALAALLGGNLFGHFAMNPALSDISDKSERGKVLNRAWSRYGAVNGVALAALVGGWLCSRPSSKDRVGLSPAERRLSVARDAAIGAVVATGLASGASGVEFSHQAPGGAVPMESGQTPAPEASPRAAMLKRALNVLGALNTASELSLAVIGSALAHAGGRG